MDNIKKELLELKEKYGDERRTKIIASGIVEFKEEDLIPEEEVVITLSAGGYIKRFSPDILKTQKRGGKGIIGFQSKEDDLIVQFIKASTHDNLLFFTTSGKVMQAKVYEIPEAQRTSRGKLIHNFLELNENEKISAIVAYKSADKNTENNYLVMATKNGIIKKTPLSDFASVRRSGLIAIRRRYSLLGKVFFR